MQVINKTKALNATQKTKNNIKQLCDMVNSYDKKNGGNGRKVREEDFVEDLIVVQAFIDNQ